ASRRRPTRFSRDWSSDVCSADLAVDESAAAQTRDSLEVDVGACVGLDSPEERFACYERSVEAARRARGESAQAVTEPPPSIEPRSEARRVGAAGAAPASPEPLRE